MPLERFELESGLRFRVLDRAALPAQSLESKVFAIRLRAPDGSLCGWWSRVTGAAPRGGRAITLLYEARSSHAFEVISASTARLWKREHGSGWKPDRMELAPRSFEASSTVWPEALLATIGATQESAPSDVRGARLISGADYCASRGQAVFRVVRTERAWLAYEVSHPGIIYEMGTVWHAWQERDGACTRSPCDDQPPLSLVPIGSCADLPVLAQAVHEDRRTRRDLAMSEEEAMVIGDAIFFASANGEIPVDDGTQPLFDLEGEVERRHAAILAPDYEARRAIGYRTVVHEPEAPRGLVVSLAEAELESLSRALSAFARGRSETIVRACGLVVERLARLRAPGVALVSSSGWQHRLTSDATFALGRAGDLVLPSPAVDRRHATLSYLDGTLTIEDLGSTSGTYLNGKLARGRRELLLGDLVRIGGFTFAVDTWV